MKEPSAVTFITTSDEDMNDNMQVPKRKLTRYLKIALGTCIVAIIFIIIAVLSLPRNPRTKTYTQASSLKILDDQIDIGPNSDKSLVSVDGKSSSLLFSVHGSKEHYLKVRFPHKLVKVVNDPSTPCVDRQVRVDDSKETYAGVSGKVPQMCLYFEDKLHAAVYDTIVAGMQCHHVHWFTNDTESEIVNSISLQDHNWYGGGGLSQQRWPLQRVDVPLQPYVTNKFSNAGGVKFDSYIEPYFISANGAALMLDSYLPLFMSINSRRDSKITFHSTFREPFSQENFKGVLSLRYKICKEGTARAAHRRLSRLRLSPTAPKAPPGELLQHPIWSTRAFSADSLNERELIAFAKNITSQKLAYSHLFIEGNYSKETGVFFFNENKFPHSHQLFMEWQTEQNPRRRKLFVGTEVFPHVPKPQRAGSKSPFAIQYKDSVKQVLRPSSPLNLDVTNGEAIKWYKSQLSLVEQIGVQGFLFADGHASSLLPPGTSQADLVTNQTMLHPNQYTEAYGKIAGDTATSETDRGLAILASGYRAQQYGLIADAGPFRSTWDHQKGLKAIIPTTITYGLLGYPFVLTGPVGGVPQSKPTSAASPPPVDLYVRWLSLSAYLPVLELAWGPWLYGAEVLSHARALLDRRKDLLWPRYLSEAVEEAARTGTPIVRPLWWVAPHDSTAQFIDCEFMLGSRLLVAPVLNDQARSRQIYLPEGSHWRDLLWNRVHEGGKWLSQYPVGLYDIATFERLVDGV